MTQTASLRRDDSKTPRPTESVLQLEVFTDLLCPWCYIGKRRLDRALEQFEHRDRVRVIWRSLQLDPDAPSRYPGTVYDLVMTRYGMSREKALALHSELEATAALDGLEYRFAQAKPGSSTDGQRLVHLGAKHGIAGLVEERLMRAYFTEGVPIGDRNELVRLVGEVGLDAEEARTVLDGDALLDEVRADGRRASALGLRGVPMFVLNGTSVLPRGQTVESLVAALRGAWEHAVPATLTAAPTPTSGCDDGACAVPGR